MAVMLASDPVVLHEPAGSDDYGQVLAGTGAAVWSGTGNLQEQMLGDDPAHAERGGAGRFGPAEQTRGTLYLPPDCGVQPGWSATVRGRVWVVEGVQQVLGPVPAGLDVTVALVVAL